ncbi:MAG: DivIVA domain-containing protein [Microscillaceae bacterium]|nr:DivIVA domain-containing protein [Microscillaceae bacterium]
MKITPIEIKQKTFTTKSFGKGYDREEVNAFLLLLSQEWEKKMDENRELKFKADFLEKEIQKSKEVEGSLFRTLKTAEDTSANIIDQARKSAELKVREAQLKAEVILNDAREQAKAIVQKAQIRSRDTLEDMVSEVRKIERDYQDLEHFKDNFIAELKVYMKEALEKVTKYETKGGNPLFKEKVVMAQAYLEERNEFIDQQEVIQKQEKEKMEAESNQKVVAQPEQTTTDEANSFFDEVNS